MLCKNLSSSLPFGLAELFAGIDMELWLFRECKERRFGFFVFIYILR